MTEIWKPIEGFNGVYDVSDHGRVRSHFREGGIRKMHAKSSGYVQVNLYRDGGYKHVFVHRLVATAFLGPSELDINHKDGNKLNNCAENLEYVTQRENSAHHYKQHRALPTGVYKAGNRYRAMMRNDGKCAHIGYYATAKDASLAYQAAIAKIGGKDA